MSLVVLICAFHLWRFWLGTAPKNMQSGAPIGLRMEAGLWKTRNLSAIGALICLSPNHQVFMKCHQISRIRQTHDSSAFFSAISCYFMLFQHISPCFTTSPHIPCHQKVEQKLLGHEPQIRTTPRSELTKSEFDVQYGVAWMQWTQRQIQAVHPWNDLD